MNNGTQITCQQLEEFVVDYIDKNLPADQQEIFSKHLDICPKCEVYIQNYKKLIEATQAAHQADPSNENCEKMPEALVQAILSANNHMK